MTTQINKAFIETQVDNFWEVHHKLTKFIKDNHDTGSYFLGLGLHEVIIDINSDEEVTLNLEMLTAIDGGIEEEKAKNFLSVLLWLNNRMDVFCAVSGSAYDVNEDSWSLGENDSVVVHYGKGRDNPTETNYGKQNLVSAMLTTADEDWTYEGISKSFNEI